MTCVWFHVALETSVCWNINSNIREPSFNWSPYASTSQLAVILRPTCCQSRRELNPDTPLPIRRELNPDTLLSIRRELNPDRSSTQTTCILSRWELNPDHSANSSPLSQLPPPAREWSDGGANGGAVLQRQVQPAAEVPPPALSPGGPGAETHLPAPGGKSTIQSLFPHPHFLPPILRFKLSA